MQLGTIKSHLTYGNPSRALRKHEIFQEWFYLRCTLPRLSGDLNTDVLYPSPPSPHYPPYYIASHNICCKNIKKQCFNVTSKYYLLHDTLF